MKKQSGSAHVVIIVILIIALIGSLGFVYWQNFINMDSSNSNDQKSSDTKSTSLTDSDKTAAVSLANDFFVKYEKIIKDNVGKSANSSTHYSFSATVNSLISEYASDTFVVHYFREHLTQTIVAADPILCVQDTADKSPYATNAKISGNYVDLDIMYFDEVVLSSKIVKDSGNYKIDSITCK